MFQRSVGVQRLVGCQGLLVVVGLACQPAWAEQEPQSEIDPIRVVSAYTPDRGEFELYQVAEFLNDGASKSTKTFTRLEYGLTDDLDVEFVVPFTFKRPKDGPETEGLGDLELEAKQRLLKEPAAPFSLAAGFAVGFPTGDAGRDLGEGAFTYEPALAVGKQVGAFSLHQDAALELLRDRGGSGVTVEGSTTSAIGWTPVERVGRLEHPTFFLALDWKFEEQQRTQVALIPAVGGAVGGLPIKVKWGLGVPIGLSEAADDWGVLSACELEF